GRAVLAADLLQRVVLDRVAEGVPGRPAEQEAQDPLRARVVRRGGGLRGRDLGGGLGVRGRRSGFLVRRFLRGVVGGRFLGGVRALAGLRSPFSAVVRGSSRLLGGRFRRPGGLLPGEREGG